MRHSSQPGFRRQLQAALRVVLAVLVACGALYPLLVWAAARLVAPRTAEGWLLVDRRGVVIGSEIIAQPFSRPGYFWPRPSATAYNGASSGGSNAAATSGRLRRNAAREIARLQGGPLQPVPADMVCASGSGLDPHISLAAAEFQLPRVARARGLDEAVVRALLERRTFAAGGRLVCEPIVNVLRLNLDLDQLANRAPGRPGRER